MARKRNVVGVASDSDSVSASRKPRSAPDPDPRLAALRTSSTSTGSSISTPSQAKRRLHQPAPVDDEKTGVNADQDDPQRLLLVDGKTASGDNTLSSTEMAATTWAAQNQWILLALASGGCAAFNGVFAKL